MTLRSYLMMMFVATLLAAASWLAVAGMVDPMTTNNVGFLLFYLTLFITVMGIGSILGFVFRFVILRQHLAVNAVMISFRQAFLLAVFVWMTFWLLARGWFSWVNLTALALALGALEFLLISLRSDNNQD